MFSLSNIHIISIFILNKFPSVICIFYMLNYVKLISYNVTIKLVITYIHINNIYKVYVVCNLKRIVKC